MRSGLLHPKWWSLFERHITDLMDAFHFKEQHDEYLQMIFDETGEVPEKCPPCSERLHNIRALIIDCEELRRMESEQGVEGIEKLEFNYGGQRGKVVEHYNGGDPYEAIKVIDAWGLGFNLGNVIKYIARAGKKDSSTLEVDLRKAESYLFRERHGHWPWEKAEDEDETTSNPPANAADP